jgi:hypothetical protein
MTNVGFLLILPSIFWAGSIERSCKADVQRLICIHALMPDAKHALVMQLELAASRILIELQFHQNSNYIGGPKAHSS